MLRATDPPDVLDPRRRPVDLTVAGRTDSGVHALGQVASAASMALREFFNGKLCG